MSMADARHEEVTWPPLYKACGDGHLDAARIMLDRDGRWVDRTDFSGRTLLFAACGNGHRDLARLLLEKGADVKRARFDGCAPLHMACVNGHVDVVRVLLDKGEDVNRARMDGQTPLFMACLKGHIDVARLLLNKGAEAKLESKNGMTPLYVAYRHNQVEVVRLLLARGVAIAPMLYRVSGYRTGGRGPTPEMVAVLGPRVEAALMAMFREGARGWAHSDQVADPMRVISGFYLTTVW